MTGISTNYSEDIRLAIATMRSGGIILYPTDTVWGIGCDATDAVAVSRVYALKRRTDSKAMLVLVDSAVRLESYVVEVPEMAYELIEVSDRPLTIVYSAAKNIASNLVAVDGSVGVRVTKEAFTKQLCEQFRKPVVSTSANISGQPSPVCFKEIAEEIKSGVDYIVRYRQDDTAPVAPSSIIRLGTDNSIKIIRK
jgi:L-threonylcarbamoyladenylate synthase